MIEGFDAEDPGIHAHSCSYLLIIHIKIIVTPMTCGVLTISIHGDGTKAEPGSNMQSILQQWLHGLQYHVIEGK